MKDVEDKAKRLQLEMWIDWHWGPHNTNIAPQKLDDPAAKRAFQRAIKRVEDLAVRLSGRVSYDEDHVPTWDQLKKANVWVKEHYAPLRTFLHSQPFTFNITESPDQQTLSLTPKRRPGHMCNFFYSQVRLK